MLSSKSSRRNVSFSKEANEIVDGLAQESRLSVSAYISKLVIAEAQKKQQSETDMREDIHRLILAENKISKTSEVMLDMFNTYLMMFATGDNEKVFYPTDKQMHVWTEKAFEAVEARIEMARYNKLKGR